jgi:D-alanyl-D-alanine dipeptidase
LPTWWRGRATARRPAPKRYNPAFSKADLFRLGYIATHSGHSTGAALDLTLVDLKADNSATFDAAKDYGDCTANVNLARRTAASTWAPATTVPTSSRTRRQIHHAGPAPLAGEAGSADGAARICKLFEGVVALFAAGRGRAGL